ISQYCITTEPRPEPLLVYTNCCQATHCGEPPAQAAACGDLGEVFVLSWSENVLALGKKDPPPQFDVGAAEVSLVTAALSNDPLAEEICPVGAWAETSLVAVPPTISVRRTPSLAGRYGFSCTGLHGTSCHAVRG